jgi:hypothetical protein
MPATSPAAGSAAASTRSALASMRCTPGCTRTGASTEPSSVRGGGVFAKSAWASVGLCLHQLSTGRDRSPRWRCGGRLPSVWEAPAAQLGRDPSIRASADGVWSWIAQLGQGKGGFYSYDLLENLVGCDIHSADRMMPEWQHVEVGDEIRLAPGIALVVAAAEPGRSLVLRGAVPLARSTAPYDFTWAFALRDGPAGTTRLLVRERYAYARSWARLIVEPTQPLSFVMSQKMLRGIRDRAERGPACGGSASRLRPPTDAVVSGAA